VLYDRLFPRWDPPSHLRPESRDATGSALSISWLGTAGHVLSSATTTVLIDPYVTRSRLTALATRRLGQDDKAIARWIPRRVDAVLCGHSHFDHLLDAPRIALLRSARIVGSRSTAAFARAAGVPEARIDVVPAEGRTLQIGDLEIQFVPSKHGRIVLGQVPFPGEVTATPRVPARMWHYRMGGAFGVFVRAKTVSVYHNGSADLVDAELEGLRADVLIAGLAGRRGTRDYVGRLARSLQPRLVIPTHHDAFFAPLEQGLRLLPGIDVSGFVEDVRDAWPHARVLATGYGDRLAVDEAARDAVVTAS
jgi:hypothetical protein